MKPNPLDDLIGNIKRTSLADQVVEKLRRSIISGVLPPGTHLLETDLANKLGVSRGALREALRTLQNEGLVESIPNRGCYVASISLKDIEEIYSLRMLLEGYAVQQAAEKASGDEIASLQELLNQTLQAAENGDYEEANNLDFLWHKKIWELSGHNRLFQVLSGMESQIRIYLTINSSLYSKTIDSVGLHQDVTRAIAERKGELAADRMREHIRQAFQMLETYAKKPPSD
jgi:DNA-binding GntR family transcriptional regulator